MTSYLSKIVRSFHLFLKGKPSAAGQSWIIWTEWFPGFWTHKLTQQRKCSSGKLTLKWSRGREGLCMESPGTVEAENFQGRKLPALHLEKQDLGTLRCSKSILLSLLPPSPTGNGLPEVLWQRWLGYPRMSWTVLDMSNLLYISPQQEKIQSSLLESNAIGVIQCALSVGGLRGNRL